MKTYEVTMHQKGIECFPYEIVVEVGNKEHPRNKAVNIVCKLGWEVQKGILVVTRIKRID